MKNFSILLLIVLSFCACNRKHVSVFVMNSSNIDDIVSIEIKINNQKLLNENFIYSNVTPNYRLFDFDDIGLSDSIEIEIAVYDKGVVFKDKRLSKEARFIYVDYVYDLAFDKDSLLLDEEFNRIENSDTVIVQPRHFEVFFSDKAINLE